MSSLRISTLFSRRPDAAPVQTPPAGARPLDLRLPDLSELRASTDRSGRGAFRLDGAAAAALGGAPELALRQLGPALDEYDGQLPAHQVQDSARRALNLALIAAALGDEMPAPTRERCAAAVAHHLSRVEQALPWDSPPELADALLSWVGAALWWPSLPGARRAWSRGLEHLAEHGAHRVHADGSPRGTDPMELLAWVEAGLLAHRAARAEGLALPTRATGALGAAAWHLYVRGVPDGHLFGRSVAPASATSRALLHAARDATLALGWTAGIPAAPHRGEALRELFAAPAPEAEPRPLTENADWTMVAFRLGRVLVVHGRPRNIPSRGILDGSLHGAPTPELVVGGVAATRPDGSTFSCLASDSWQEPELARARIDPRQARGVFEMGSFTRDITFRRGQALVLDTPAAAGAVSASWSIAEGWEVRLEDGKLIGEHPDARKPFRISLDDRLQWSLSGRRADGRGSWDGDIYEPLRTSLEWT